jgi:hypothetical protein
LYTSSLTSIGSAWSVNGPATTIIAHTESFGLTTASSTYYNLTAYDTNACNATSPTTAGNTALIDGVITPSANGTLIVRFAAENTGTITAKAGSTLEWW